MIMPIDENDTKVENAVEEIEFTLNSAWEAYRIELEHRMDVNKMPESFRNAAILESERAYRSGRLAALTAVAHHFQLSNG